MAPTRAIAPCPGLFEKMSSSLTLYPVPALITSTVPITAIQVPLEDVVGNAIDAIASLALLLFINSNNPWATDTYASDVATISSALKSEYVSKRTSYPLV